MKIIALLLAFLLEVAAVVAFVIFGLSGNTTGALSPFISFVIPIILVAFWGTWMAPKSKRRLSQPYYGIAKTLIFIGAFISLLLASKQTFAAAFFIIWIVDEVLLFASGESRPRAPSK